MADSPSTKPGVAAEVAARVAEALEAHQRNDLPLAEGIFRTVLRLEPTHFIALHQLGVLMNQRREYETAAGFLGQALAVHPRSALAHLNLGISLSNLARHEEALAHYDYSLVLQPGNADALLNAALALRDLQRPEEAVLRLGKLLHAQGDSPAVLLLQGGLQELLGRSREALASFERALALQPISGELWVQRGLALLTLGRPEEALASYDQALALAPEHLEAHRHRGDVLYDLQRLPEALAEYGLVLAQQPDHADVLANCGNLHLHLGNWQAALACFDRTLLLQPLNPALLSSRGMAQLGLRHPSEALRDCEEALRLDSQNPTALIHRGHVLRELKRLPEALADYDQAIEAAPTSAEAFFNRGLALHLLGRHGAALASYDTAAKLNPNSAVIGSSRIYTMDFLPEIDFVEHQAARRDYFLAHAQKYCVERPSFAQDRNPDRPLTLGYVSADFRHHSAASSFGPVLKHHNKARFKVVCYSGVEVEDDWTRLFKLYADLWRPTNTLTDDELARVIQEDGVDILIDLSGHSKGNRLPVFARQPAPIQVTAWGHCGGTGLPMMDYQFTDPVFTPTWARPLFAEASKDLPCCLTFEQPPYGPEVTELPALAKGHITFGSLNRFTKVTPTALDLWAEVLGAIPDSRMLFKDAAFDNPEAREELRSRFVEHGIQPERIETLGYTSRQEHLAAYGEVDIILDTFPQNGGITTWEALWMGVPVVTILGNKPPGRISGAILYALGLEAWVGENEGDYVKRAILHATDLQALSACRQGLRASISASAAGNPERYTRAVEAGYRAMWKTWVSS